MVVALACLAVLLGALMAIIGEGRSGTDRRGRFGGARSRGRGAPRAPQSQGRPPSPAPGPESGPAPNPPSGPKGPAADQAWVTLVMLGDAFVPGALVLAHSLRRVGTARALVCMVTPDVSRDARVALATLFDHVREVPYISAATAPLPTEKQRKLYPWISRAYTKWNCLGLVQWRRVIFVDADMCFAENADELFELPAPAGCFCSAWLDAESPYLRWWRQRHPSATELPHGAVLPPALLRAALESPTFTAIAALVSLNTDEGAVARFRAFLEAGAPYGTRHRVRGSGADETSIVEFTARAGQAWRHIHPRYEAIPRKTGWGTGAGPVKAWHFHGGDKPWAVAPGAWPDLALWWAEAARAREARPGLTKWLGEPTSAVTPAR